MNKLQNKNELAELIVMTINGESGHPHLTFGQDMDGNWCEASGLEHVIIPHDSVKWQGSVKHTSRPMTIDLAYDCIDNAKYMAE